MKRWAFVLLGVFAGLVAGGLLSYAFNAWYAHRFVRSDDEANLLAALLLFGFLPVGAVIGAALGREWVAQRSGQLLKSPSSRRRSESSGRCPSSTAIASEYRGTSPSGRMWFAFSLVRLTSSFIEVSRPSLLSFCA